jgi:hypothetical protein
MSRSCCQAYQRPVASCGTGFGGLGGGGCCCSLPTLIILILIVLQFGKKDKECGKHEEGKLVDNGILFIIALFYLSCCVKC